MKKKKPRKSKGRVYSLSRIFSSVPIRVGFVMAFIGLAGLYVRKVYFGSAVLRYDTDNSLIYNLSLLFTLLLALIGSGLILYGYLEGYTNRRTIFMSNETSSNDVTSKFDDLKNLITEYSEKHEANYQEVKTSVSYQIIDLSEKISELNKPKLNELDKSELFAILNKSLQENINEEFFKSLNVNISTEVAKERKKQLDFFAKESEQTKSRLLTEIGKLSRKANINLVIGSLTTVVALIALGFVVFSETTKLNSWIEFVYHYFPRLSLIIFIEIFAFFFLQLYKANLADVKFYQSELTTVELKLQALTGAISFGKEIDLSSMLQELSRTERNVLLRKEDLDESSSKSNQNVQRLSSFLKLFSKNTDSGN